MLISRRVIGLTFVAVFALLATGWISDRSARVMDRALSWVVHTRVVLGAVAECRVGVLRAETVARAYAITGTPEFQREFDSSARYLRDSVAQLKRLTADNAKEQASLARISTLIDQRLDLLRALMDAKQRGTALLTIQTTVLSGALVSNEIDRSFDRLDAEEEWLLDQRTKDADRATFYAIYAPWAMCLVAALVVVLLLREIYRALLSERTARRETDRAMAEERAARHRAEESDRLKDEFLATISHELRTPLTAIVGWASLLRDRDMRADLLETGMENIHQAAETQSRLVEDLLDMSRIVTGKMRLTVEPVDLKNVIEQVVSSLTPSAEAKGITIRMIADTELSGILGDSGRVQQIVWNLLSNAVKFTPKDGRVDVTLRRVDSHVEISVADNGEGIAPDFLPFVFDRFRQAESGPTRRSAGLGLGLAITKQLVELHGGAVRVASAGLGSGSTFTVELPITGVHPAGERPRVEWRSPAIEAEPRPVEAPLPVDGMLRNKRVVVIEDDERTLQFVLAILSRAGAAAAGATNAADGFALIATEPTDALICDIGLPDEDGIVFMRRFRSMLLPYSQIPAIALTAFTRAEDRVTALSAGFNLYLAKPVTREELLFAVSSVLRSAPDTRRGAPKAELQPT